jgi:endonuclease YncB( thermonuclease family)
MFRGRARGPGVMRWVIVVVCCGSGLLAERNMPSRGALWIRAGGRSRTPLGPERHRPSCLRLRGGSDQPGGAQRKLKALVGAIGSALQNALIPAASSVSRLFQDLPPRSRLALIFAGGLAAGVLLGASAESLEIYSTADDVPGIYFKQARSLTCRVVAVSDGDTLRVEHTPPLSTPRRALRAKLRARAGLKAPKLSDTSIAVRLAAIDTPEVGKFGKPAQPYAEEAKAFVKERALGRTVRVKLLSRDQYGRAVATVRYPTAGVLPGPRDDLSEALLRNGLAVVYRQGGAQYDSSDGVRKWDRIEAQARGAGRGLWSTSLNAGGARLELPSEYKARMRKAALAGAGR